MARGAAGSAPSFRLEALEPRWLLSADPVLGAAQAVLAPVAADPLDAAYGAGAAESRHGAIQPMSDPPTVLTSDLTAASVNLVNSLRVSGDRRIEATSGSVLVGNDPTDYVAGDSAVTADELTIAATGNVRFQGEVGIGGAPGTDGLLSLTITAGGNVTFEREVVIDGAVVIDAGGTVTFEDELIVRAGGSLTITGAAQIVLGQAITLVQGNAGTPGALLLEADEIDLSMGEELIVGTGSVTLRPATLSLAMALFSPSGAGTQGTLNLEALELRAFADGFSSFTLGHENAGRAAAGTGAVLVGASTSPDSVVMRDSVRVFGGSITVADYSHAAAILRLSAGDTLELSAVGDVSIANEIEADAITLESTSGLVRQQNAGADNRTNEALRTPALVIEAATGISLFNVEVGTLALVNTGAGDIAATVGAARTTTRFDATLLDGSVDVLLLAQTAPGMGTHDIALATTAGALNVAAAGAGGQGVAIAGAGTLALAANGAGSDLRVDSPIAVTSGAVAITAADALSSGAAGSITASGAADITLTATAGALLLGAPVTSNGGVVAFVSGSSLDLGGVVIDAGAGGGIALTAATDLVIGVVQASGSIALTSTAGRILDGLAGDGANLAGEAAAVTLSAAGGIGSGAAPLRMAVGSVGGSTAQGGLFLAEETSITVSSLGLTAHGSTAGQGAVVLRAASGDVTVQGAVRSLATGTGGGHVLLEAAAGGLSIQAGVESTTGSVSLLAAQALALIGAGVPATAVEVRTRAAGQTIDVRGGGAVALDAASALITASGAVRVEAGAAMAIGRLDTTAGGTLPAAAVALSAGGGIGTGAGAAAAASPDVRASSLRLEAGGAIGAAGDALMAATPRLAAGAAGGIFLAGSDSLAVGSVTGVVVNRVAAAGTASPLAAGAALDGLRSSSGGAALALAAGSLTLEAGAGVAAGGAGGVHLSAPGRIDLAAPVATAGGAASVLAGTELVLGDAADVATTGGAIDLAAGGALTMGAGRLVNSAGGAMRVAAGGALVLGRLDAGSGDASVLGFRVLRGALPGTVDLTAGALRLEATGSGPGEGGLGSAAAPLAIDAATLAARASGPAGVFLAEAGSVVLAALPAFAGMRVAADGSFGAAPADAALAGLAAPAGPVVLVAAGALGSDAAAPVDAAGALRLAAGAGSDLTLDGAVNAGTAATLVAGRDLRVGAAGTLAAGGAWALSAGQDLMFVGAGSLAAAGGSVRLDAGRDVALGLVDVGAAGTVGLVATGVVTDGDTTDDVIAGAFALIVGAGMGSGADPLELRVGTLAGNAGGSAFFTEADGLAIATATAPGFTVGTDAALAATSPLVRTGFATPGILVLASTAGDLTQAGASAITAASMRLAAAGSLTLAGPVASAGGAASLHAGGAITLADTASITTLGGALDLLAGGAIGFGAAASASTKGGALRAAAGGVLAVGLLDAGGGTLSIVAAALRDAAGDAPGADLRAGALRLELSGAGAGGGAGTGADPIEIAANTLAASAAGGGLHLVAEGSATIAALGAITTSAVLADGSTDLAARVDAALAGAASAGALVIDAAESLTVGAGAAVQAAGALRLAALGAGGDLRVGAAVSSSGGAVGLAAGRDLIVEAAIAAPGSGRGLDATAGRDIGFSAAGSVATGGGTVALDAGGGLTLGGAVSAGAGSVWLRAGSGSVTDTDADIDLTAAALSVAAAGAVGQCSAPLQTAVNTLAASAGASLFVRENAGLRIDTVAPSVQRVAADGSVATVALAPREDLIAGEVLVATVASGDLTLARGTATPATGASAVGAIRLEAAGQLLIDAAVTSAGGPVSLLAGTNLGFTTAEADVNAAGTLDVEAAGNLTMADGSVLAGSAVRVFAGGTASVGAIVSPGAVAITARSVTDAGAAEADVSATSLAVRTTGTGSTQGFGTGAAPLQLAVGVLAAEVAGVGAGGLFVAEADGVSIGAVAAVAVQRVGVDGMLTAVETAALSDVVSAGNVIVLAGGDIVLGDGADADGLALDAAANVLLQGSAIALQAALRVASGNVTLQSGGGIALGADLSITRSGRTADLIAGGSVTMAATARLTTTDSAVRVEAAGDVLVGAIEAGTGALSITAGGRIAEVTPDDAIDLRAGAMRLVAGDAIGAAAEPIETAAIVLAARAGAGGITITEADVIRIGDVSATVRRVGATAITTEVVDAVLSDLVTTAGNGSILLATIAGDIDLTDGTAPADGRSVTAAGSGSVRLVAGGSAAVLDVPPGTTIEQQGDVLIESALRVEGPLVIEAGVGEAGGGITITGAIDGGPGTAADTVRLVADGGPVVIAGPVGSAGALASFTVERATDVRFDAAVTLTGPLVIGASGVVTFAGPLNLTGGDLVITGASSVVLGEVVVAGGDVVISADALALNGPVRGDAGQRFAVQAAGSAVPVVIGPAGGGLHLDAAELARITGFGTVAFGTADDAAVVVDAATLASLATARAEFTARAVAFAGASGGGSVALVLPAGFVVQAGELASFTGSITFGGAAPVVAVGSAGSVEMAPGSRLVAEGGAIGFDAAGRVALGVLVAGAAGSVLVTSDAGPIVDADADTAANVQAGRFTMLGRGAPLANGASDTAAALDIAAGGVVQIEALAGVVVRDALADGRTRFVLAEGAASHLQAVVEGSAQREPVTSPLPGRGADAADPRAQWLAALRPLAESRAGPTDKAGLDAIVIEASAAGPGSARFGAAAGALVALADLDAHADAGPLASRLDRPLAAAWASGEALPARAARAEGWWEVPLEL